MNACLLWLAAAALTAASADASPPLHPILEPAFQQELNAATNSVLAVSDEIALLVDGKESYPVRWRMLENARHYIYLTTMYIFPDETTKRLAEVLIRKKKEGVDVKLIVFGTYALGSPSFHRKMRKAGVEVKEYSSVWDILSHPHTPRRFWKRHLHDKYLVVDGVEALTGGMNWSGRYERGGTDHDVTWRDTDIWVRGPQALVVAKEFEKRWRLDEDPEGATVLAAELDAMYARPMYPPTYDSLDFMVPDPTVPGGWRVKGLTRFLYQQPFENGGKRYMTKYYKAVMDRAQSRIWWQSISIRPAPIQKTALLAAAARGVDVRLMTNAEPNMRMIPFGGWMIYQVTRAGYRELLEGGIRIFEYRGPAPLHAKGFLVDDVVTVVGSYNATFTSERFYTESGIATLDTDVIADVRQMFNDDFAVSQEITIADLDAAKFKPRRNRRNGK
ncbi:MAG: hypothetical protein GWP08_03700 [Nitrospiraceae bacterium]|nr:hypothetical protein [Nitrospiraceae bacterium]